MADYQPLKAPGRDLTFTASAGVTAGQLLLISGSNTVAPTSTATAAWIGVAYNDAASGGQVTVSAGGVHSLTASGAVTAGDQVVAAANGQVATSGTPGNGQQVGIALTTATSGNKVSVKLQRG